MSEQQLSIGLSLVLKISSVSSLMEAEILDEKNFQVLHLLEIFDKESLLHEVSNAKNKDLQRIEAKLDSLFLMFAHNFMQQTQTTQAQHVELSADHLLLQTQQHFDNHSFVLIELFVEHYCPQALLISGRVVETTNLNNGLIALLIEFVNLGSETQAYIEKLVFRLHRKQIAQQKQYQQT